MRSTHLCGALFTAAILVFPALAGDWSRFRGPDGSATANDATIPTEWSATKNLKWKLKLPGKGFSSPVIVGDKVFVTCYTGESGNLSNLKRYLVCVDRQKGTELWSKEVPAVLPEFRSRGQFAYHGYASNTPVSDGERVYVFFGTTGVLAFDMKGNKVWQKSVGTETNSMYGSASSPILYKDMVIVTAGSESQSIRAFERKTGKEVWKAEAANLSRCYGTPLIARNKEGQDDLLVSVAYEVWGLNPETGKLRWYAQTQVDDNACTSLILHDGITYAVGGRTGGRTAIKVGGKGDVTKSNVLWSKRGGSYICSPTLYNGNLFWIDQRGTMVCVDSKTGDEVGRKRLNGSFYASMVVVKGKLYVVSRFDGTYVVEASPKLTEIAHNKLSDDSDFSGSPAVVDNQLFLRSDKYLYCIENR